jgi:hypothetical protein
LFRLVFSSLSEKISPGFFSISSAKFQA